MWWHLWSGIHIELEISNCNCHSRKDARHSVWNQLNLTLWSSRRARSHQHLLLWILDQNLLISMESMHSLMEAKYICTALLCQVQLWWSLMASLWFDISASVTPWRTSGRDCQPSPLKVQMTALHWDFIDRQKTKSSRREFEEAAAYCSYFEALYHLRTWICIVDNGKLFWQCWPLKEQNPEESRTEKAIVSTVAPSNFIQRWSWMRSNTNMAFYHGRNEPQPKVPTASPSRTEDKEICSTSAVAVSPGCQQRSIKIRDILYLTVMPL